MFIASTKIPLKNTFSILNSQSAFNFMIWLWILMLSSLLVRVEAFEPSSANSTSSIAITDQNKIKNIYSAALQEKGDIPTILQIISGNHQQALVDTLLPQPLVVKVIGSDAELPTPLTLRVIKGNAIFVESGTDVVEMQLGAEFLASAQLQFGSTAGPVEVIASYPNFNSVVFELTALPLPIVTHLIAISGDNQIATTGLMSEALRVRITQNGNAISGNVISWSVISGDATIELANTPTDDNGEAKNTLQIGTAAGNIVVRARSTATENSASLNVHFNLTAADGVLNVLSGEGQDGAVYTDADEMFVFELRRANGLLLAGEIINFNLTGNGSLDQSSTITDSNGRASVGLRYGNNPGVAKIRASAFNNRISATATAASFVPDLVISSGNHQAGAIGTVLANPLVIQVIKPAQSEVVSKGLQGLTVQWTVITGDGQLGSAISTTDSNGRANNTWQLGSGSLGGQSVQAAIIGIGEVLFEATGSIPDNSVLEIISGNQQTLVPQKPSAPLVVRFRTPTGAGIPGVNVHFISSNNLDLSSLSAITGSDGRASTIATAASPGNYTVTAHLPDISDSNSVVFVINNGLANIAGLTPQEIRIAHAMDNACLALAQATIRTPQQSDLMERCNELVANADENTDDVINALRQMLGEESSAQNNAALASTNVQLDNIRGRVSTLRSSTLRNRFGGIKIITPTGVLPLGLLPLDGLYANDEGNNEAGNSFSRLGFFATGNIGRGSRDARDIDPGGEFDNYGLTAGIDYRINDSFVLGAALGFNSHNSKLHQSQGNLSGQGYSVSSYGTWYANNFYTDAVLTFGHSHMDVTRRIHYTIDQLADENILIDQIATGSPDHTQQSFSFSAGKDFQHGTLVFGPYIRSTFTRLAFDDYIERMSATSGMGSGLALAVDHRSLNSTQVVLGSKIMDAISTSWGVFMPTLQVEYVRELKTGPEAVLTRFAFDPSRTEILIDTSPVDNDFLNIGVGLSAILANGRSAYAYYEHLAGKYRTTQNNLTIGVRIEF